MTIRFTGVVSFSFRLLDFFPHPTKSRSCINKCVETEKCIFFSLMRAYLKFISCSKCHSCVRTWVLLKQKQEMCLATWPARKTIASMSNGSTKHVVVSFAMVLCLEGGFPGGGQCPWELREFSNEYLSAHALLSLMGEKV